jgi:hydroxyacyl-ACP dehydratase HTD2-like protein with hotdog domain
MEFGGLDRWMASIASTKRTSSRIIDADHLADLYATLPLRSRAAPADRTALGYGHHFAFFHPHVPEVALRPDGTESDFSPPEPFTRRMWVGGWIKWRSPILVGERATEYTELSSAEKKGNDLPMVFVTKRIRIQVEGKREPALEEERTHVFLHSSMHKKGVREGAHISRLVELRMQSINGPLLVEGLPPPSFSFQYTPSPTTLFRFSALTFNSHLIHLDKDYAQSSEDYPGSYQIALIV